MGYRTANCKLPTANNKRLTAKGINEIVRPFEIAVRRFRRVDVGNGQDGHDGDAAAGHAAPRTLGRAFAEVAMKRAVEVDDGDAAGRLVKRLGHRLPHRLVLDALREVEVRRHPRVAAHRGDESVLIAAAAGPLPPARPPPPTPPHPPAR